MSTIFVLQNQVAYAKFKTPMHKALWKFIDHQGTFTSDNADQLNTLYFPLVNHYPLLSSVTADLHGDIKTDYNSFLMPPVSRIDLSNSKVSRNFWVYLNPKKIWSATGVSKDTAQAPFDQFKLEAGLLWHKIIRQNKKIGLKAEIISFVPATDEPVEIMYVTLTNISKGPLKFTPTTSIPIYGRSANNLRDHRQVSSLLNRTELSKFGVVVKSTLLFDESGHKKNPHVYFVFGLDQNCHGPQYIYPTQEEFTGDNSDLEAPSAVLHNRPADKNFPSQGKEAVGALKFKACALKPRKSCSYIIVMGIAPNKKAILPLFNQFNCREKVEKSLEVTKNYWQAKSKQISLNSADTIFDNWFRWVTVQPRLRKIFGCSFLPDFDYGKGGRGWRDLWQDYLALLLNSAQQVKPLLINNFKGVRIDGSHATIIGQKPGEFLADRNLISRVWMDHGVWPWFTLLLYIHQTGDLKILFEETTYFKDHQLLRSQEIDKNWDASAGKELKTKSGKIYCGTILEHILVENLIPFFNVGPHNHIRLENADWNDGLDMATQYGESVAFSAMYAHNLRTIAETLEKINLKNISLLKELAILFSDINYADRQAKEKILNQYLTATKTGVSGKKILFTKEKLIRTLKEKAAWMGQHIQKDEWLKTGFFNGYYDNCKQRVEGRIGGRLRMTLTGQVFAVMSGIATQKQVKILFKNCQRYLKDKKLGGFRLNTDFGEEQLNLGRAFSFVYGDKENGAFFSHMAVMFAYALYKQGFIKEGYEVLDSLYRMSVDSAKSKIYPCLPEYFNAQGRGMYSYLTGSASWLVFAFLTQVLGIRGEYGDLVIEPKLKSQQFQNKKLISLVTYFADKKIEVEFIGLPKKQVIRKIILNGKTIPLEGNCKRFLLDRRKFLTLANKPTNTIEVVLG